MRIENLAGKRENPACLKKKIHKNRNLIGGILLAFFAIGILTTLSFFLLQKYSRPNSFAEILPSEETLLFAELQLDENLSALGKIFDNKSRNEILEFDSLGFTNFENLLALAENRIGVAFLGNKISPQNFALILDITDRDTAIAFFESETLAGESLATQNFLGQKIYYYPSSRALAFTFFKDDLILATDRTILQKIAKAINSPEKRLSSSAEFRTLATKFNPRENFIFCAPRLLNEFFISRLVGPQKAFAAPFLDLWSAGGATFFADDTNLKIKTQLILKNSTINKTPFLMVEDLNEEVLNLWGEETQTFLANKNLSTQVTNFWKTGGSQNSIITTIAKSTTTNFLKNWFGDNFTSTELALLFENSSSIGLTTSGGIVAVFENDQAELFEKLKTANGKIAATEKIVALPDTTPGYELTVEDDTPQAKEELFASHKIKTIHFPKYDLSFVRLENLSIFSSEKETLKKMISRFVSEEKFLAKTIPASGNIFYAQLDKNPNPFLQPFLFAIINLNFESDSVRIELSLEK